jgi:hypothetical protein
MDTKDAGRIGGLKTAKRGKKYYQEIQKKSAAARSANRKRLSIEDYRRPGKSALKETD